MPEGRYIRTYHAGDFVHYDGRVLTRPQDILGRGAYFDRQAGEVVDAETSQIREAGFNLPDDDIDLYQGIKMFRTMDDLIGHIRNSGHFRFFSPFTQLDEREVS